MIRTSYWSMRPISIFVRLFYWISFVYRLRLALTSSTCGGRSVGIVRLRAKITEFFSGGKCHKALRSHSKAKYWPVFLNNSVNMEDGCSPLRRPTGERCRVTNIPRLSLQQSGHVKQRTSQARVTSCSSFSQPRSDLLGYKIYKELLFTNNAWSPTITSNNNSVDASFRLAYKKRQFTTAQRVWQQENCILQVYLWLKQSGTSNVPTRLPAKQGLQATHQGYTASCTEKNCEIKKKRSCPCA
jgi:hypothetical protein